VTGIVVYIVVRFFLRTSWRWTMCNRACAVAMARRATW